MKYLEEMYIDSQIFAGDIDGSESNFTEKIVIQKTIPMMLRIRLLPFSMLPLIKFSYCLGRRSMESFTSPQCSICLGR